ncbi:MAG: Soluble P-type ATPase [Pelotomaculum thermopropionicum]|uniref:Soluble P-type ATPase n=1 Tax=Pelotomaculum thermopropionicum TaxID=110500 RepID=A0A124FYZ3_9FIRM|nr:MAG: Soluble P-type ATPase [Pelotomaculum thermopropionicum]
MFTINIPGNGWFTLKNVILDFNGTIALDGDILPGVKEKLNQISNIMDIYILTADTFGTCASACSNIKGKITILKEPLGSIEKLEFIHKLGANETIAIGNGTNDEMMLKEAILGIAVLGPEGASFKALTAADVIVPDIICGLTLLLKPKRLVATLRG